MTLPTSEKPDGYHEHHRQKRRGGDERPVNKLYVGPQLHEWIELHPEEAARLGWTVSQDVDPAEVVVVLPDPANFRAKREVKRGPEKPRDRATISFKVPKDKREDGAGLFDDLWAQAVEKLEASADAGVTTEGLTGQYGALLAILYAFVTS